MTDSINPAKFQGLPWESWTNALGRTSPIADKPPEPTPVEKNIGYVMKLPKEDMKTFGLCPERDPFSVIMCQACGLYIKPQALLHHFEMRHNNAKNDTQPVQPSTEVVSEKAKIKTKVKSNTKRTPSKDSKGRESVVNPPSLPVSLTLETAIEPGSSKGELQPIVALTPLSGAPAPAAVASPIVTKAPRRPPRKHAPIKEREYDPDKHCGVISAETSKPCTWSLTCKSHPMSLRRAVTGRSKPFDQLLADHRQAKEALLQAKKKNLEQQTTTSTILTPPAAQVSREKKLKVLLPVHRQPLRRVPIRPSETQEKKLKVLLPVHRPEHPAVIPPVPTEPPEKKLKVLFPVHRPEHPVDIPPIPMEPPEKKLKVLFPVHRPEHPVDIPPIPMETQETKLKVLLPVHRPEHPADIPPIPTEPPEKKLKVLLPVRRPKHPVVILPIPTPSVLPMSHPKPIKVEKLNVIEPMKTILQRLPQLTLDVRPGKQKYLSANPPGLIINGGDSKPVSAPPPPPVPPTSTTSAQTDGITYMLNHPRPLGVSLMFSTHKIGGLLYTNRRMQVARQGLESCLNRAGNGIYMSTHRGDLYSPHSSLSNMLNHVSSRAALQKKRNRVDKPNKPNKKVCLSKETSLHDLQLSNFKSVLSRQFPHTQNRMIASATTESTFHIPNILSNALKRPTDITSSKTQNKKPKKKNSPVMNTVLSNHSKNGLTASKSSAPYVRAIVNGKLEGEPKSLGMGETPKFTNSNKILNETDIRKIGLRFEIFE